MRRTAAARGTAVLLRLTRALLLLALVMTATVLLVRVAPGYFTSAAELDSAHAGTARLHTTLEQERQGSPLSSVLHAGRALLRGDLGESRQYEMPVSELLRPRIRATTSLLLRGIGLGWLLALGGAAVSASGRRRRILPGLVFTLLLAIPSAAMATLCLLRGCGGPVMVLALVVAARDFPFLDRLFRDTWLSPALLHARAAGLGWWQMARAHAVPAAAPQLGALATLSLLTALSALVPVEVLFDLPGVAQLAWNAAGNRDLPVLLAVTLLLAAVVAAAGALAQPPREPELA